MPEAKSKTTEIQLQLNDHSHAIGDLTRRVDIIEEKQDDLQELVNTVNKLAINMEYMVKEQQNQNKRLEVLEKEPVENAKYYKRIAISCVITTIIGVALGALLSLLFK